MKSEPLVKEIDWQKLTAEEKHKRKLERYAKAHFRTAKMADYLASEVARIDDNAKRHRFEAAYDRMRVCGTGLAFREFLKSGDIQMLRANFCTKYYLCPFCAILRAAKCSRAYIERLEVIQRENPGVEPWFVTFTVKNGFDLMERYTHLKKSFRAYQDQRRQGISRGRNYNELNKAKGAVYSTEIAWDKKGRTGWHPHIHMVALCDQGNGFEDFSVWDDQPNVGMLKKETRLATEWARISGDSFVVDARPMHTDKDVAKNFSEVFKYALKFSEMSLKHNFQAAVALQGARLVGSFGLFRGVVVPDQDDAIDVEDLAYVEKLYHYFDGKYNQVRADCYDETPWLEGAITSERGTYYPNIERAVRDSEILYAVDKIEAAKVRKCNADIEREDSFRLEWEARTHVKS